MTLCVKVFDQQTRIQAKKKCTNMPPAPIESAQPAIKNAAKENQGKRRCNQRSSLRRSLRQPCAGA
jgi:hypothetical protein